MVQEWNGVFPFPALNCRLRSLQHTKTCSKGGICLFRKGTSHLAVAIKWGPVYLQPPKISIYKFQFSASNLCRAAKQWTTWKNPQSLKYFYAGLVLWSGTPWAQLSTSGRGTVWGFDWIWCTGCLFCRDELSPFPAPHLLQLLPTWQSRGASSELMRILLLSPAAQQLSDMLANEPLWKYIYRVTLKRGKKVKKYCHCSSARASWPCFSSSASLQLLKWLRGWERRR